MDWLKFLSEEEQKKWSDLIIDHAFEEIEWRDARSDLLVLLQRDGKKADESAIRSYLSCCAESAGSINPLPSLSSLVAELYATHGMESALPI